MSDFVTSGNPALTTLLAPPDLAELEAAHRHASREWRNGNLSQARARDTYNHWFHEACRQGHPPDALQTHDTNEQRRFNARTIPGIDGHIYWANRTLGFTRNDGKQRNARTWWWEHEHGPILDRSIVKPTCGDPHCINPAHAELMTWGNIKRRFSDAQCVGAIQVAALRLGRTPGPDTYDELGLKPSSSAIRQRFASWGNAVRAAGLEPAAPVYGVERWSDEECVAAVRRVVAERGVVPSGAWWARERLSPSLSTLERRFGGWLKVLEAADLGVS